MTARILVSGMACGDPRQGGATWAVAQYLLGFRRLGHEVWLLEPVGERFEPGYAREVMRYFELEDRASFVRGDTFETVGGVPAEDVVRLHFDLHLNIAGMLRPELAPEHVSRRVYLDLDPGFTQLWQSEGIDMRLAGHDRHFTVGQAIGTPRCEIPTCGIDWLSTLPPIVLERWPMGNGDGGDSYTSVGNWRSYGTIHRAGVRYGQRAHSLRELSGLPRMLGRPCSIALAISPDEHADLALIEAGGWALDEVDAAAGTPARYERFLRRSRAELGIAKEGYVASRSGWFSDRSACYLASGRPVVAQDTGARVLPTGLGIQFFSTAEEAVAAFDSVESNYAGHARAARALAEEYLDSDRVLSHLLDRVAA